MADQTMNGRVPEQRLAVGTVANWIGAGVSLALVLGVGVWGYNLLVADVSGVPVVRAAEGPARVAPEDPGGEMAENQGLSVNKVAGNGTAEAPADRLVLAPRPVTLEEGDDPVAALAARLAEAQAQIPAENAEDESAVAEPESAQTAEVALTAEADPTEENATETANAEDASTAAIMALAEKLAAGNAPLEVAAPAPSEIASSLVSDEPAQEIIRPKVRPSNMEVMAAVETREAAKALTQPVVPPAMYDVKPGTRLIQIGAYPDEDTATAEWVKISGRLDSYFKNKQRVIQKGTSDGKVFYRLRVAGFSDADDARRFCSALKAENLDCYSVVAK